MQARLVLDKQTPCPCGCGCLRLTWAGGAICGRCFMADHTMCAAMSRVRANRRHLETILAGHANPVP